jgi:hypothetical protein
MTRRARDAEDSGGAVEADGSGPSVSIDSTKKSMAFMTKAGFKLKPAGWEQWLRPLSYSNRYANNMKP